jgi:hypothetical protein
MTKNSLPFETLAALRVKLDQFGTRSPERKELIENTASLYGVSAETVYRALRQGYKPKGVRRADQGKPRKLSRVELNKYCEVIAALKVRTTNKKGRHVSTVRALEILEKYGIETPQGLQNVEPGTLNKSLVNRYLKIFGYDQTTLSCQPPSVRFQAEFSNACWQFDMSPSELKHVEKPLWIEEGRGAPTLMLFSLVDDRSGAAYTEYRCVYGEDAESALRFLYNGMAAKELDGLVLHGIPEMIYMDNGPVAKSNVFKRVMEQLGIQVNTHMPAEKDGRRKTARSKGKVERPFRTVKEVHETLYHFHKPENEAEANLWLQQYVVNYNQRKHRTEDHSRAEDWLTNLPATGLREMCTWDRYCSFAREPERRLVGSDARVKVDGTEYEVSSDLAGQTVILWWGLFDNELFVEYEGTRSGPYHQISGPIPLNKYRKFKKTPSEQRADRIEELANKLGLPRAAITGEPELAKTVEKSATKKATVPFPSDSLGDAALFPNAIIAKLAIAHYFGRPLGSLPDDDRAFIAQVLEKTLNQQEVMVTVKAHFARQRQKRR